VTILSPKQNILVGLYLGKNLDQKNTKKNFLHEQECSVFDPSQFLVPGWTGEGLITSSALIIKNTLNNLSIDALSLFKKTCGSNKSLIKQTHEEFVNYAKYSQLDSTLVPTASDFWFHLQDDSSPYKKTIDDFLHIHCFRAVAIYLFRMKFILDLSEELKLDSTEEIFFNPSSFLGRVFKKNSSTELHCESLQINQYSWYRPSREYRESLLKLKDAFKLITLTELIKLISTPQNDKIYSIKNYSHALSHLTFGLLVNDLLLKLPNRIKPTSKLKNANSDKICLIPKTICTRFIGNNLSSFALSHWLAQETNVKQSQWDNVICPDFSGSEFVDGHFLKYCQELQFLSFLNRMAVIHHYEIIPFICKIMKDKYKSPSVTTGHQQSSFFDMGGVPAEQAFDRLVLNLTELPKTNPHHYLLQQIYAQRSFLNSDSYLYVFTNQNLFVPSSSEKVDQLLKEFKLEALFNLENLKGKGEIAHYIYIFSPRTAERAKPIKLLEVNRATKESCLSFEFKGNLSRFNKFNKFVEEFSSFVKGKSTPVYSEKIDEDLYFDFHQDAVLEGKLVSSSGGKDKGQMAHPSFFKNLTKSCITLENFFQLEQISHTDIYSDKKNIASELLGLSIDPIKKYPLLLIINQSDPLQSFIEITTSDSFRAKVEQYGTAYYYYFGLTPKHHSINLNIFREYFMSSIGHQIIQMQLVDGPLKLKSKLKSLLIPRFFAETQYAPEEVSKNFALLEWEPKKLNQQHPLILKNQFESASASITEVSNKYPWHLLGLLSHFKLNLQSNHMHFNTQKLEPHFFSNPLISDALVKLKTHAVYPKNQDVYIEINAKNPSELHMPLSSVQLLRDEEEYRLLLKFQDTTLITIHAPILMNHFLKFILNNAIGIKVSDILINLKVPSQADLEKVVEELELINNTKEDLISKTENLILQTLRNQILST
jgi:hypothetical protein